MCSRAASSEDATLQSVGMALIKPSCSYLRFKAGRTRRFYCSSFAWTAQHMLTLIPGHRGSKTSHQPPGQSYMYRKHTAAELFITQTVLLMLLWRTHFRGQRSHKQDLSESSSYMLICNWTKQTVYAVTCLKIFTSSTAKSHNLYISPSFKFDMFTGSQASYGI